MIISKVRSELQLGRNMGLAKDVVLIEYEEN